MRSFSMLYRSIALTTIPAAAMASTLPFHNGVYVLERVPCKEPPLAAMMAYRDGAFSYPHATKCTDKVVTKSRGVYHVVETCSALGDGTPANSAPLSYDFKPLDARRFTLAKRANGKSQTQTYRLCTA